MNEAARADFLQQIAAYQDGGLSDPERSAFDRLLREDPDRRALFIETQKRSVALIELHQRNVVVESTGTGPVRLVSHRRIVGWVALAASVLMLIGWFVFRSLRNRTDVNPVVARVTYEGDAVWASTAPRNGEVPSGLLELRSGVVRLALGGEADVTLQGPAAYEVLGPLRTRLHHGVLAAHIPASANGFKVETPAMDVVDLGTAFGISVRPDGTTAVSVFQGSVEVRPPASPSALLKEGETVRAECDTNRITSTGYDASPYDRVWPVSLGVTETTGAVRFVCPGPPWDLTKHYDDNNFVVFPETGAIPLHKPVEVDTAQTGRIRKGDRSGHSLPAGRAVRSYLMQFNPVPKGKENAYKIVLRGRVTFARPIAGVIWTTERLAATDALFGAEGARYKTPPKRGLEIHSEQDEQHDQLWITEDRRSLTIEAECRSGLDHVRVLVEEE